MSDTIVKHVTIASDLSPKDAPSLSIHVLAKNADVVLGRWERFSGQIASRIDD